MAAAFEADDMTGEGKCRGGDKAGTGAPTDEMIPSRMTFLFLEATRLGPRPNYFLFGQ